MLRQNSSECIHMEHERVPHGVRMSRWFFLFLMNRLPEAYEQQDKICVTHIQLPSVHRRNPFSSNCIFSCTTIGNWPKIRFLVDGMGNRNQLNWNVINKWNYHHRRGTGGSVTEQWATAFTVNTKQYRNMAYTSIIPYPLAVHMKPAQQMNACVSVCVQCCSFWTFICRILKEL